MIDDFIVGEFYFFQRNLDGIPNLKVHHKKLLSEDR